MIVLDKWVTKSGIQVKPFLVDGGSVYCFLKNGKTKVLDVKDFSGSTVKNDSKDNIVFVTAIADKITQPVFIKDINSNISAKVEEITIPQVESPKIEEFVVPKIEEVVISSPTVNKVVTHPINTEVQTITSIQEENDNYV